MKIQTRFRVTMFLFGAVLIAALAFIIITDHQARGVTREQGVASDVAQKANELSYLSNEYLIYREDRQVARWQSGFGAFSTLTDSLTAGTPEEKMLVKSIRENTERLSATFSSVLTAVPKLSDKRSGDFSSEIIRISSSRLAVQTQGLFSDAQRLSRLIGARAHRLITTGTLLGYVFLGLFGLFLFANYMLTYRRTISSMAMLQAGATAIGSGDLDFRIARERDDELGDLADAFNLMAAQRKRAEEAVRAERQRLYDVFETLPVMICLLTRDYHIAFANRSFREKFGEAGGRHCYELCFGQGKPCDFCESYRVFETGTPHQWEVTAPDGSRTFAAYDFPFTDADGSPMILEMDIDITEQRRAQRTLREVNETLEQRVAERTSELSSANEALRASRLAALNLMEDSVAARREAEKTSAELRREVAERARAEEQLRQSEHRFALLSYTANELLQSAEPQKMVESLCRKVMEQLDCQAFFNFLVDESARKPHLNACAGIPADEAARIEWLDYGVAVCGTVARQGHRIIAEHIPTTPDKKTELVASYGIKAYACHPLLSETGKVIGTLSFGTKTRETFSDDDISLMKAVADQVAVSMNRMISLKALQESEERFRTLADNISQLAWMTDARGRRFWFNKRWFEYTGATLEEANGWGWEKFHHPDHVKRVTDNFTRSIETGEPWEDMSPLRGKDGEYRWFLGRALPIRNDRGEIVRWFGTDTDITDQRRVEQDLRRRTQELAAANKELEAFSYSVSHDLRAPLRSMKGFSQIVLDDYSEKLDPTGRDCLTRIAKAAERMNGLIDDMLSLSRISRQEMIIQEVDLSNAALSVITELRASQPERTVEVSIEPDLWVRADARLVNIALSNLLGNAWKYTGKTEHARIELGSSRDSGERVFYIRDNGAGFDMNRQDKLFTPFQRLHSEREFPGTGIGLPIVKRVIQRHGGRVWGEGEEGRGAVFYFTFGQADVVDKKADAGTSRPTNV